MALSGNFSTDIGVNGAIANVESALYLADSSTCQVTVGVYLDQTHFDADGSKPFFIYQQVFDTQFDPTSSTPMVKQAEADLIARFVPFSGATQI